MTDVNQIVGRVLGGSLHQLDIRTSPSLRPAGNPIDQNGWEKRVQEGASIFGVGMNAETVKNLAFLGTGTIAGGMAGGLVGGKKFRKATSTALQIGAVAAIGGLAYKAYQNYRQGKPVIPQSIADMVAGQPQRPATIDDKSTLEKWIPPKEQIDERAKLILKAMVAAAVVDGHLDGVEYDRIRQALSVQGYGDEEQLYLSRMIMRPSSIEELAEASKSVEDRVEVYTAARLTLQPDTHVENEWLQKLAEALNIEPELKTHLDAVDVKARAMAA